MCWRERHEERLIRLRSDGRAVLKCKHCGLERITHDPQWLEH
jgi:hypothetical protein